MASVGVIPDARRTGRLAPDCSPRASRRSGQAGRSRDGARTDRAAADPSRAGIAVAGHGAPGTGRRLRACCTTSERRAATAGQIISVRDRGKPPHRETDAIAKAQLNASVQSPLAGRTAYLLLTIYPRPDGVANWDKAGQVRNGALCCRPAYLVIARHPAAMIGAPRW